MGRLVDRIKKGADAGVHSKPPISPADAIELFEKLLRWLVELSSLSPPPEEHSLAPYEEGILDAARQMLRPDVRGG